MRTIQTPPEPYSLRINNLRDEIARRKVDGYLVQDRMDQYWLTGFTGEDGPVLITAKQVVLLTDGRFDEAADREAPYARKVLRKKRTPDETVREVKRCKVRRLGFNPDQMSVAEFNALKKLAVPTRLVALDAVLKPLRASKDGGEVDRVRAAIRVAEQAFEKVRAWLRPGLTEREIAAQLVYEMQKLGAQGESFPTIVAAGANSSLPHYEPGDRQVKENEVLLFDWGARLNWYCSDLTRVMWFGSIPAELRKVFDVVREAHDRGIQAVRPGIKAKSVDRVARDIITMSGYGKLFNHGLGHGLGLLVHEPPRVAKPSVDVLKPGMVITIEPGIYLPGVGGVRLEDDVLVTETGYEVLSTLPVELA
jgi:Xaa-Pro aminopeptidase